MLKELSKVLSGVCRMQEPRKKGGGSINEEVIVGMRRKSTVKGLGSRSKNTVSSSENSPDVTNSVSRPDYLSCRMSR